MDLNKRLQLACDFAEDEVDSAREDENIDLLAT